MFLIWTQNDEADKLHSEAQASDSSNILVINVDRIDNISDYAASNRWSLAALSPGATGNDAALP